MVFIQMSGFPGSGKSTLACQIAKRMGAVIIDHDISKSALLDSFEEFSIETQQTGKISYNLDWALIEFHLSQGQDVIFDSPCLYDEMIDKGIKLSKEYRVKYKYIECYLNDMQQINYRLKNRERKRSQIVEVKSKEAFEFAIENSGKPSVSNYLVVDTSQTFDGYIDDVMKYISD